MDRDTQAGNGTNFLAAVGDSNCIRTWSGIPYHLLMAGQQVGLFHDGLRLSTESRIWKARAILWNARQWLQHGELGGYQFSDEFLDVLWRQAGDSLSGRLVVNCFQLYPKAVIHNAEVTRWFYIDMTLRQLFDYYGVAKKVGSKIREQALDQERLGYHAAKGVIAHSSWAAESVIRHYGVHPSKVHVIQPGANLDQLAYEKWAQSQLEAPIPTDLPLRMIFVGKDAHRKGLDRLLRAMRIANRTKPVCTLTVVGASQKDVENELARTDHVVWRGFISKERDAGTYMQLVAEHQVGCLLSRAEAGGIALREYHALGLAVLGPATGGSPDHMLANAATAVRPGATDEEVADVILQLALNPDAVSKMRFHSWASKKEVTWLRTAEKMHALISAPAVDQTGGSHVASA